ncbi:tRNA(Phe) (4-demethylwyosine(37)-C(7)) aminocarboxypropyltransferase [Aspergillus lucknowensis]|uniref:tRNA wybutosine-synthesizing protein 2 n=1 Tax=Aspergillus lucknowensis TaxID=176173 RepID=A0ABR4LJF1_9EURO
MNLRTNARKSTAKPRVNQRKNGSKRLAKQNLNPLQKGIQEFIAKHIPPSQLSEHGLSPEELVPLLPKRYTVYEPMLLLPLNAFTHPTAWGSLHETLSNDQRQALYACIAKAFSRFGVSHIAMNAPIAAQMSHGQENRMRSPVGLVPLYGHFGPTVSEYGENAQPSEADYKRAFWVRTVQNNGIAQVWAPLHTMFSRGNITEKARILGHGSTFEGLDELSLGGDGVGDVAVVDMYAGIGYFVFSYLKRGVKRVWGWEVNGWSVEGLRRGCLENGWGCRVVRVRNDGQLNIPVPDLVDSLRDSDRVVIFHGDNRFAADILGEVRSIMEHRQHWTSIRQVNLGLLPSSRDSWHSSCEIIDKRKGGWVHVHENVDIQEIPEKRDEITANFERGWAESVVQPKAIRLTAECRHVEHVKTFAPGVMHCVFDLRLSFRHEGSAGTGS